MKREKYSNFFLNKDKEYKRLSLGLYLFCIFFVAFLYFILVFFLSIFTNHYIITAILSILSGFYLVFDRERIFKKISTFIFEKNYIRTKKKEYENKKKVVRSIVPKENSLKVKTALPLLEQFKDLKEKFSKKEKKSQKYIEIK